MTAKNNTPPAHVVIVGGGFGGLYAARTLARANVRITLIDRRNHHLFQPLLYQVATAGLSAPDIAAAIRQVMRSQKNVLVLQDEVTQIDRPSKQITLRHAPPISYDYCIIAAGMVSSYFGNDAWEAHAPSLKTLSDAMNIRRRILSAFEAAERTLDESERQKLLNFIVIGGGPTGVEMAGALGEMTRLTLMRDFRRIHTPDAHITLIEGGPRILSTFSPELSEKATQHLNKLGITVRCNARVTKIDADGVWIGDTQIEAKTVIWGAGVRGAGVVSSLGAPLDRGGRVLVEQTLTVPGDERVFVVGDVAAVSDGKGGWVPGVAPAAIQQGTHAALNIRQLLENRPLMPFKYWDKGSMAALGRRAAIAEVNGRKLSGMMAWLLWVVIHIFFLINFRNRVVVMWEWFWAYITYHNSSRVIWSDAEGKETKS
jgi:NADH dehydrogenase